VGLITEKSDFSGLMNCLESTMWSTLKVYFPITQNRQKYEVGVEFKFVV